MDFNDTLFGKIWNEQIINNIPYRNTQYKPNKTVLDMSEDKVLKFNKSGLSALIEIKNGQLKMLSVESKDLNFIFENENNDLSLRILFNLLDKFLNND